MKFIEGFVTGIVVTGICFFWFMQSFVKKTKEIIKELEKGVKE